MSPDNDILDGSGAPPTPSAEHREDFEGMNTHSALVGESTVESHAGDALGNPDTPREGRPGSRAGIPLLSIDTQAANPPTHRTLVADPTNRSPPGMLSPQNVQATRDGSLSPRTRNRGLSLRSSIFARNFERRGKNDADIIEMDGLALPDSSPTARPQTSKKDTQASVVVSAVEQTGAGDSADSDSDSDGPQKFSSIESALPYYQQWLEKRARRHLPIERLQNAYIGARKFVLRIQEIPPSKDGRHIPLDPLRTIPLIDERTGHAFVNNFIKSSKYNGWNFVPRQLVAQFRKLANAYFLIIAILQMIPGLSTTGTYTTIIPLMFFVSISIAKEGIEDARRHRLDKEENNREALVLRPCDATTEIDSKHSSGIATTSSSVTWTPTTWQSLLVGDIVKLTRDTPTPADVVLLSTTGANNIAYVETMALDGETNLKPKQPPASLAGKLQSLNEIFNQSAVVVAEDPNLDLYKMDGRIIVDGNATPLTNNEIIYRGSVLRNTPEAVCMIVYSGEDSKIRMNANKNPRIKRPSLQAQVNKIVFGLVIFVISLAVICTVGYSVWSRETQSKSWYLIDAAVPYSHVIVSYIIMFNTLIPLSLYVSLEIIKVAQMFLLNDIDMYDSASNTPFEARTSTINEELGQVSYIFSDKTGTLTQNVMRFRKLSVAGTAWLHDVDLPEHSTERRHLSGVECRRKNKGRRISHQWSRRQRSTRSSIEVGPSARPSESHNRTEVSASTAFAKKWQSSAAPHLGQPELSTTEMIRYVQRQPYTLFAKKASMMLVSMAVCHTCLPERMGDEDSQISFQAASPDELALVQAARELGYLVYDRAISTLTLKTYPNGIDATPVYENYEVLNVIEFSSKRKRMSVVVRFPDGRIHVICKGADSIITPRLRLAKLARSKISEIDKRVELRKSMEAQEALRRRSSVIERSGSIIGSFGRPSMSPSDIPSPSRRSMGRFGSIRQSIDGWLSERENDVASAVDKSHYSPRPSGQFGMRESLALSDRHRHGSFDTEMGELVEESLVADDASVLERCFQHINDFATEGLRTLLYGHRCLDEQEYRNWTKVYHDASTSLFNRQELIENAAELIERDLELGGATAIEDELQEGVPETIERLRRANIKLWMLTGDKRETAINIGHSCRLIKDYSAITVLDHEEGGVQASIAGAVLAIKQGSVAHSVVVVDGQTLSIIEADEALHMLFLDLAVLTDSVVCCRASPSQKAALVNAIRRRVSKSVTLAIGDGANDIAMIQEAHVGIGLTGKEGLQAARASDYSIAQFRFLTKLLLVHGRWNYVRTCKYTVGTFWKEMMFYLTQALFQRWNGYTGTSLYEQWSLSMFNTLFTSLPVIFLGIFEQDLAPATLIAVPELYSKGQRGAGFNYRVCLGWIFMAASEAMIIFFTMKGLWGEAQYSFGQDAYSNGVLSYTACIVLINTKLQLLEQRNKTVMAAACVIIEIGGWFLWNVIFSIIYQKNNEYDVRRGFLDRFGCNPLWWLTLLVAAASCVLYEWTVRAVKNAIMPTDAELFAELERDPIMRRRFEETSAGILSTRATDLEPDGELSHEETDGGLEEGRPRWPLTMNAFREKITARVTVVEEREDV